MMNFTLSNQVQIPAVGIGTLMTPVHGRAGGCGRISMRCRMIGILHRLI